MRQKILKKREENKIEMKKWSGFKGITMTVLMMMMLMRSWSRYSSVAGIFDTPLVAFFRSKLFDTHHTHRIHTGNTHAQTQYRLPRRNI